MVRRAVPVILLVAAPLAWSGAGEPSSRSDEPVEEAGQEKPEPAAPYAKTPAGLVPFARSPEPYRRFFVDPLAFRGPGREEPEPEKLSSVRIGLLAPLEDGTPDAEAGRSLQDGVQMAFQEANATGGYGGLPFELIPRNDQALWGSSGNTLVELAYEHRVWAVIGSIDSNSTHVAIRVALKAEIPVVTVGSTDPTLTETGIPWVIRCTPDDRQTGYRLARLLFQEEGFSRVAVLRSSDRYGRFGVKEFRDAARRLTHPLPMEILLPPDLEDFGPQLDRLALAGVDAVVLWTRARQAGAIVRQMRERGLDQPVFGTDRLVSAVFLELAGGAAEGVTATYWMDPDREDTRWLGFRRRFAERFGGEPDAFAAYGYDAATLLVGAVRQAGLNRARIRDVLGELRSFVGVTGTLVLDMTSNNISPIFLAKVEGGRFVFR